MEHVETGVQTLYYGLGVMLGGVESRLRQESPRPHRQTRERACRVQAICGRALRIEGIFGRDEEGDS